MRYLLAFLLILMGCAPPPVVEQPAVPEIELEAGEPELNGQHTEINTPEIVWANYIDGHMLHKAIVHGKYLLVYVRMDSCEHCDYMEKKVFANPVVARIINRHFIPVMVDVDNDHWGIVAMAYQANKPIVVPKVIFVHPSEVAGELIAVHVEGVMTADRFVHNARGHIIKQLEEEYEKRQSASQPESVPAQ